MKILDVIDIHLCMSFSFDDVWSYVNIRPCLIVLSFNYGYLSHKKTCGINTVLFCMHKLFMWLIVLNFRLYVHGHANKLIEFGTVYTTI